MRPDTLSVILRSASFVALFQAAGMAIFFGMFGRRLESSRAVLVLRLLGLSAIIAALDRADVEMTASVIAAALVITSFLLIGHTAAHPLRWELASLLILHLLIVAFWFGALLPLYLATRRESAAIAANVTEPISQIAGWHRTKRYQACRESKRRSVISRPRTDLRVRDTLARQPTR